MYPPVIKHGLLENTLFYRWFSYENLHSLRGLPCLMTPEGTGTDRNWQDTEDNSKPQAVSIPRSALPRHHHLHRCRDVPRRSNVAKVTRNYPLVTEPWKMAHRKVDDFSQKPPLKKGIFHGYVSHNQRVPEIVVPLEWNEQRSRGRPGVWTGRAHWKRFMVKCDSTHISIKLYVHVIYHIISYHIIT